MTASAGSPFGNTVVPAEYQSKILVSSARWNVSAAILAAQLDAESSFNPRAVSPAGAVGIAQFLPETARSIGVDPWNVDQAIDGMARLDAQYVKQFGSIDKALAAYNAGPGAVSKYAGVPPYAETQNYVKKILDAAGSALSTGLAQVSLTDPINSTVTLLDKLMDASFWKRIGVAAVGVALAILGIYFMLEKQAGSFKPVRKIAENLK